MEAAARSSKVTRVDWSHKDQSFGSRPPGGDSGELQRYFAAKASGEPESRLREEMWGSGEVAAASGSMPIRFQWVAAKEESHLPPAPGGVEGGGARLGGVIAEVTPNGVVC